MNLKNLKYIQNKRNNIFKGNINYQIKSLSFRKFKEDRDIFIDEKKDNFLPKILKVNKSYRGMKLNSRNNSNNVMRLNLSNNEKEK